MKLTDHSVHLVHKACRFLSSRGLEMRGPSQIKPSGSGDENDHFQPILPTRSLMLLPKNVLYFFTSMVTDWSTSSFIVRISTQLCGHGYCLELEL